MGQRRREQTEADRCQSAPITKSRQLWGKAGDPPREKERPSPTWKLRDAGLLIPAPSLIQRGPAPFPSQFLSPGEPVFLQLGPEAVVFEARPWGGVGDPPRPSRKGEDTELGWFLSWHVFSVNGVFREFCVLNTSAPSADEEDKRK